MAQLYFKCCDPINDDTPNALDALSNYLTQLNSTDTPVDDFQRFEQELKEKFDAAQRQIIAQEMKKFDVDVPVILVGNVPHKRALRWPYTYMTHAGAVRVERTLYRASPIHRAISPMELSIGIIDSFWTPHAAGLGVWAMAHLTSVESEDLFARVGGMNPSKSSLDRLPKEVSSQWEANREAFELMVRATDPIPEGAVAVGVSLDGIMVPMKDGKRVHKREAQKKAGKQTRGPSGYREAACGTLTFYDKEGQRLGARLMARMPEAKKATLKSQLMAELDLVLAVRPDLTVVGVADGANDNWTFLEERLPQGSPMVVDFYHASEHLRIAVELSYGKSSPQVEPVWQRLRSKLLTEDDGVERVIRALAYQCKQHPRRKALRKELNYFRKRRKKMKYAQMRARNLPIGSGEVEAANKTLVTVRIKRAGARWTIEGGQAILTFRVLSKSARFDRAWGLLSRVYRTAIKLPDTVVPFPLRASSI